MNRNTGEKSNISNQNPISETDFTKEATAEICSLLAKTSDQNLIQEFLECLCTKSEIKDFADRWLLVKEIEKGTSQREIAKKFGMSLCKITRGSKELHKDGSAFKKMLDLLKQVQ